MFFFICILGGLAIAYVLLVHNKRPATREIASAPSARRSDDTDSRDAWEGSFWEVDDVRQVATSLRIQYRDRNGSDSQRVVDVHKFGPHEGSTLIIGHCHLRQATRTFRTDRISLCIDAATGEIVADAAVHLQALFDASPVRSIEKLKQEQMDTLRALLYVGKADGQLRSEEKAVIRETCAALSNDDRVSDFMIDSMLKEMSAPSLQSFKVAVGRIAKAGPDARNTAMAAAEKIVNTQKTVHPTEKDALDYMKKRFSDALN